MQFSFCLFHCFCFSLHSISGFDHFHRSIFSMLMLLLCPGIDPRSLRNGSLTLTYDQVQSLKARLSISLKLTGESPSPFKWVLLSDNYLNHTITRSHDHTVPIRNHNYWYSFFFCSDWWNPWTKRQVCKSIGKYCNCWTWVHQQSHQTVNNKRNRANQNGKSLIPEIFQSDWIRTRISRITSSSLTAIQFETNRRLQRSFWTSSLSKIVSLILVFHPTHSCIWILKLIWFVNWRTTRWWWLWCIEIDYKHISKMKTESIWI